MKSHKGQLIFQLTLLGLVVVFEGCQPADNLEADREAIEELVAALGRTITAGDVEGVMSLYTEDAMLLPPNQASLIGKEAMRAWQETAFEGHSFEVEIASEEIGVSGDMAFSRGTLSLTATSKTNSESFSGEGKYILILRRQNDGSWKATHDIWNDTPN